MDSSREWPYRAPWRTVIWVTLLFGVCTVVLGFKASGNDRGLIINRIIELDLAAATKFYWGLAAASALFTLLGVTLGYQTATTRQRIAIGAGTLTMPASRRSKQEVTIPLREAERLRTSAISGQRSLELWHAGRKYTVSGAKLPRKRDFDELVAAIAAQVPGGA